MEFTTISQRVVIMSQLETASHPENLKRVVIEPITRVEGHGKITLLLDDANHIQQARLHIVEFRGFEKFIQGRPYWEVPVMVQRLCGICPVSHHLAAAKAVDMIVGVMPSDLTPAATNLRRLMHLGQMLQSHALHFFHLSSPDLLFGFEDAVAHRNIIGVIADHPEIGKQGILLRKYGQEVIRHISGKRVHGTAGIPGGMNKPLSTESREIMLKDIEQMITWSQAAVNMSKQVYLANADYHQRFAFIESNMLSLIREDGALDLYHGGLRAKDRLGKTIFDQVDYVNYDKYINEEIKSWSYMKFPFIISKGTQEGWYRVGPLARINNCNFIPTPLAEKERQEFMQLGQGGFIHASLAYHWARMIEMLHAAEGIKELLLDDVTMGNDLVTEGVKGREGIGVIEAPRGTLFHHYRIDEDDKIEMANLIVSTTNNNQAMNESIRQVAQHYLDGHTLTEGLLNHLEVAVRAYDPCLSCATHALGKMPLHVELLNTQGEQIDCLVKSSQGEINRLV
jgi:NAD-reducing hydrogenase large subunit